MGSALTGISRTSQDSHKSASTVYPSLELRGEGTVWDYWVDFKECYQAVGGILVSLGPT